MKWMTLVVVVVGLLVSNSVRATEPWDPDGDDLKFRVTFDNNPTSTTTIADDYFSDTPQHTGTLTDYNAVNHVVWRADGRIGGCADFNHMNDKQLYYWPDPNIHFGGSDPNWGGAPNDCRVWVDPDGAGSAVLRFGNNAVKRSWAFWFNDVDCNEAGKPYATTTPGKISFKTLRDSVLIRHQHPTDSGPLFWDICIKNSKLQFRNFKTGARMAMETATDLNSLGVKPMEWHHAVVVIDRTTGTTSQIYLDGLAVPVVYGALPSGVISGNINPYGDPCPLYIGANGSTQLPWAREGDFDGMLDDIRVYHKALSPTEVSILYQTDYNDNNPIATNPFPGSKEISIATGLEWIPAENGGLTAQEVFFGKVSGAMVSVATGDQTLNAVSNALLGGDMWLDTEYQWQIVSTIDDEERDGLVWKFTTESGIPVNPSPADDAEKIMDGRVNLSWTAPNADSTAVYFSTNEALVTAKSGTVLAPDIDVTDSNIAVTAPTPGATYYWRVVGAYPHGLSRDSAVWSFRAAAYPIVFNTSGTGEEYYYPYGSTTHETIPARSCKVRGPGGWSAPITGTYIDSAGAVVVPFDSNFIYNDLYDIIVIPEYQPGNDATAVPTSLVIDVNGDFSFDGTMDISGDDAPGDRNLSPAARCGGHRGPRKEPVPGVATPEIVDSSTAFVYYTSPMEFETRYGTQQGHNYYPPTRSSSGTGANPKGGYGVFGEGTGPTPPYKNSGGAGYGGKGGDSGRGYQHGIFGGGIPYGDKEVPVPFGGSASSWSQTAPGNAGGGGVEIDARHRDANGVGNVTLGPHARIYADGGTTPYIPQYPSGGGSGGSVKIVAEHDVVIDGYISVDGGKGGDGNEKGNNTGGGGGGGRVAIFYGNGDKPDANHITANGGARGVIKSSSSYPLDNDRGLSEVGGNGTIYIKKFTDTEGGSPRRASAPTPRNYTSDSRVNDSNMFLVYAPTAGTSIALKWYSGLNTKCNKTTADACDYVYCRADSPPVIPGDLVGTWTSATRGQHSVTKSVDPDKTYYWKVRTITQVGVVPPETVDSNVWTFKTVGWRCQAPSWDVGKLDVNSLWTTGKASINSDKAGWPAWDKNRDCVVNDLDFWEFAKNWNSIERGGGGQSGNDYNIDISELDMYTSEWITCRARTNSGCLGWPVTPDWIPASDAPL
jgi:hypothetical protein